MDVCVIIENMTVNVSPRERAEDMARQLAEAMRLTRSAIDGNGGEPKAGVGA